MAIEGEDATAEARAREERIRAAAEKIAKSDPPSERHDEDEIAREAGRAGLEQAHRSAFTHP